jgi:hypothetical protein
MLFNTVFLVASAALGANAAVLEARATNTALQTTFPASSGTSALSAAKTIAAGATFDGGMKLFDRSSKLFCSSAFDHKTSPKSRQYHGATRRYKANSKPFSQHLQ